MDKEKIKNIKEFLLDLFFPKFCLGCKKEGTYLCIDCKSILEVVPYNYCLCNFNPMRLSPSSPTGKCRKCQKKNLTGLYFALSYKDNVLIQKLIHYFKYPPFIKELSSILADFLIEHFVVSRKNTNEIWEGSILIPVPLSNKKLKTRGYNQAEELAKELSKILKVPVIADLLIKVKETLSQVELKKEEREKNLGGVFEINKKRADLSCFKDKKIFLVDDVYTTGSTMEECAKILKKLKPKEVWGIAVAREG